MFSIATTHAPLLLSIVFAVSVTYPFGMVRHLCPLANLGDKKKHLGEYSSGASSCQNDNTR